MNDSNITFSHDSATSEELATVKGSVIKVIFRNGKNGFSILRIKQDKPSELINIQVNSTAPLETGSQIECRGQWVNHTQYGKQFQAIDLQILSVSPTADIEKYLHSGLFKGIGTDTAKKIVEMFGEDTFDVLQNHPEKLIKINGIGRKRQKDIEEQWKKHQSVHELALFLQPHGISANRALRIHKLFGKQALEKITANPYQLTQIPGIGFHTADHIAKQLGLANDAPARVKAGITYILQQFCEQGHCAMPRLQVISDSTSLLDIEPFIIIEILDHVTDQDNIVPEDIDEIPHIFPRDLYYAETQVVKHLQQLKNGVPPWKQVNLTNEIPWLETHAKLSLSESQKQALNHVFSEKFSIITGGPGVGKTTLINCILMLLKKNTLVIELCAPTGRAAKRLTESTGFPAKTIHRLLGYDFLTTTFTHNLNNKLDIDVLIVDEASMIDIKLFHALLMAIPKTTAVIIVGDVDQLPSVGSGAVLFDLIQSHFIKTIYLTEIFRQAANSQIIVNAHRVNHKQEPLPNDKKSDFYTIKVNSSEQMQAELLSLVTERLPKHFQCNPIHDIQVLTPMHRSLIGTEALNNLLQQKLNSNTKVFTEHHEHRYYVGDKVIQMVNNYDKEIFNGDIGIIQQIHNKSKTITIQFDTKTVEYKQSGLKEISLAYAITIHKSQGSEYPVVVIPLALEHKRLLAKNLLYTAITRGKKLVVLIIQEPALDYALQNDTSSHRITKLKHRLQ